MRYVSKTPSLHAKKQKLEPKPDRGDKSALRMREAPTQIKSEIVVHPVLRLPICQPTRWALEIAAALTAIAWAAAQLGQLAETIRKVIEVRPLP